MADLGESLARGFAAGFQGGRNENLGRRIRDLELTSMQERGATNRSMIAAGYEPSGGFSGWQRGGATDIDSILDKVNTFANEGVDLKFKLGNVGEISVKGKKALTEADKLSAALSLLKDPFAPADQRALAQTFVNSVWGASEPGAAGAGATPSTPKATEQAQPGMFSGGAQFLDTIRQKLSSGLAGIGTSAGKAVVDKGKKPATGASSVKVVRVGTLQGRRVAELGDGRIVFADTGEEVPGATNKVGQ